MHYIQASGSLKLETASANSTGADRLKILIMPGDGIGPEITAATRVVIDALAAKYRLDITLEEADSGLVSFKRHGATLRNEDLARAKAADGVILGPMSIQEYPPRDKGGVHVTATLRKELALYANIRPSYVRRGIPARVPAMDLVLVRENLEDFYADRNMFLGVAEFMPTPDVALAVGKITRQGTHRVARAACEIAIRRPRRKLTIVHKDPVLKLYNGLFVEEARNVAREFPEVQVEDLLVDAVAALLVRTPERFDVVLMPNTFGDILSDEASELAGSLGLAASLNRGDTNAVANAGHGSAPDIAGKDVANPTSLMMSAAMLFEHLGETRKEPGWVQAAQAFKAAVDLNLENPKTRTRDVGGTLGTAAFGAAVATTVREQK
jgi:isocitrate dehydrogenase (NAD+)